MGNRKILLGFALVSAFAIFTVLVQTVDVKPLGVNGTSIGFSGINIWIHNIIGVNMTLYTLTDWAGLVPIFVILAFAVFGFVQLIEQKSITKVDTDILILGVYYIIVFILYAVFEFTTVNYRPVLINGIMEASYPSSTTLLVMCVMPTLSEQLIRRCENCLLRKTALFTVIVFSAFVVIGRLLSGVHWLTDIVASLIVSLGLFELYRGFVLKFSKND